jgi:DNA polymerase III delta prime subunit
VKDGIYEGMRPLMNLNYYRWPLEDPLHPPEGRGQVIEIKPFGEDKPEGYVPHPELVEAVNVALALGHSLLLTGEPGTGKTTFAASVAFQLRCPFFPLIEIRVGYTCWSRGWLSKGGERNVVLVLRPSAPLQ